MTGRSYKSILYHIVFHTKKSEPYLEEMNFRNEVYQFIKNKCKSQKFYLFEIGGTENHIHLLIYIPPKIAVSKAVKLIKGASSYYVNHQSKSGNIIRWQEGYGIFTVSKQNAKTVQNYIKNQQQHHEKEKSNI